MNKSGRNLPQVVSKILTFYNSIVEPTAEDKMDFLIPAILGDILHIPEQGSLSFSYSNEDEETINSSYDSEFFSSLGNLFVEKGKLALATYPEYDPGGERMNKMIQQQLSFANATFRLYKTYYDTISYLLVFFKYVAFSDEKQEGVVAVLINTNTLATLNILEVREDVLDELQEKEESVTKFSTQDIKAIQSSCMASSPVIQKRLEPFIQKLQRRLNRDIARIYEYYETLKAEVIKQGHKKNIPESQFADKLKAIETEKSWKIQDLVTKYALKTDIEIISAIRIQTNSIVSLIKIKRRLATREFPLNYNPIARVIEPVPCESCFYPRNSHYVCDDHLHLICGNCFSCLTCGKQFCRLCNPQGCPKCKGVVKQVR